MIHFRVRPPANGLFVLILLLSSSCVCFGQGTATSTYRETIPYTPVGVSGAPLVDVTFNKTVKAHMLFDSGTNCCAITQALASKLGLAKGPFMDLPKDFFVIRGESMRCVKMASVDIGHLDFHDSAFVILDPKYMPPGMEAVDGFIGANGLSSFSQFFDFQKHEITLFYPSPSQDDLKAVGMEDAKAVPLQEQNDGDFIYFCPISVTNESETFTIPLHVDTGSEYTILDKDNARELGMEPFGQSLHYSTYSMDFLVVQSFINSVSIAGQPANVLSLFYTKQNLPQGTILPLGLDLLSHYRVLLDLGKKMMYIKPVENASPSPQGAT